MTTITAAPSRRVAGAPHVSIEARELIVNAEFESGIHHRVHLVENDDLGAILHRGQRDGGCDKVPNNAEDTGLVIVSLGVDDDHDEIHYVHNNSGEAVEVLTQAIEALQYAVSAARRVKQAGGAL